MASAGRGSRRAGVGEESLRQNLFRLTYIARITWSGRGLQTLPQSLSALVVVRGRGYREEAGSEWNDAVVGAARKRSVSHRLLPKSGCRRR